MLLHPIPEIQERRVFSAQRENSRNLRYSDDFWKHSMFHTNIYHIKKISIVEDVTFFQMNFLKIRDAIKIIEMFHLLILFSKLKFLDYTEALIDMLIHDYEEDQRSLKNSIQELRESVPPPLSASFAKPCKETAVEEYVSRFA